MRTDAIRDLISDAKDGSPNLLLHMPGSLQNNPDAPPDFLEDVGYHIIHRETGKYLTLENDTCDDGVKLQLRDLDGSASQWFRFEAAYNDEDGYSNNMIVSDLCGDKAITSEGDSCLKGVDVQLSSTAGSFSQFLYPFKNGEDWVLTNTYCDRVLEVSNGVVQLNEDTATLNQKWEIVLADISEAPSMAPTGSAAPTLSMAPSGVPTSSIMPSATPSLAPSPVPSAPPSMMPSSPPTSAPTREPCAEGLTDFVFEILTDDYSYETSFDLKNDCTGATVFSKSAVDLADGEYSVYARCLPPARYTFRVRDSFGDGIFWPGYFSLVIDGVFVTQQRRDFGTQYASSFGDAGVCDGGDGDCPCDDYGFILRFLCRILNRAICRA